MEAVHALLRAVAVATPPGSTLQASRLEDGGLSMVRSDAAPRPSGRHASGCYFFHMDPCMLIERGGRWWRTHAHTCRALSCCHMRVPRCCCCVATPVPVPR